VNRRPIGALMAVHIARNEGSTNLTLWATYFDVPPGGPFRIDRADPGNCSF